MKYRIYKRAINPLTTLCLPLLFLELIFPQKPYVIQYKKHWWSFWEDYKEEAYGVMWTVEFETYKEAEIKFKKNIKNGKD